MSSSNPPASLSTSAPSAAAAYRAPRPEDHALVAPGASGGVIGDDAAIDLTNCDREPIHVIGQIQPYGALLAALAGDPALALVQVSDSVRAHLDAAPDALLGRPLAALLEERHLAILTEALASGSLERNPLTLFMGLVDGHGPFHVTAHRSGALLLLELEPRAPEDEQAVDPYAQMRDSLARFQEAASLDAFCRAVADEVRKVNGFDRVMVYRFNDDDTGTVVAESMAPGQDAYLGLRYPASDIPKQSRALYLTNAIRLIADARYTPSLLTPPIPDAVGAPTDLSQAFLRGVSALHTEYLANMGVTASMSLAIAHEGRLWGLIACHHRTPRRLAPSTRAACEFLSKVISLQVAEKQTREGDQSLDRSQKVYRTLVSSMARETSLINGLCSPKPNIADYIACGGCVVLAEGERRHLGETPTDDEVDALVNWLQQERGDTPIFSTDSLATDFAAATQYPDVGSGLLALRISGPARAYVLWFRPEQVRTVDWAGNPDEAKIVAPAGADEAQPAAAGGGGAAMPQRLHPRKSFALWQETVFGTSAAWDPRETEAAERLRAAVSDVLLRRVEELSRLNVDLARSNSELDSFAYIASHDLKEPLRGINNYAHFLQEDYDDKLDDEGRDRIATLVRLTGRMDSLLNSLLRYSQTGRQKLDLQQVNLNIVVREVLESFAPTIARERVTVQIPRPLPTLPCDPDQIQEVFSNLISNAVKYNARSEKRIEIGYTLDVSPPGSGSALTAEMSPAATDSGGGSMARAKRRSVALYVRDNGIGLKQKHYDTVFQIFKRLHGRDEFGGGAGAGLTIAAKIVQRHGGRIWVQSEEGVGSTFYFTLEG